MKRPWLARAWPGALESWGQRMLAAQFWQVSRRACGLLVVDCEWVGEVTTLGCGGVPAAHEAILCVHESRSLEHVHTGQHSVCYWRADTVGRFSHRVVKVFLPGSWTTCRVQCQARPAVPDWACSSFITWNIIKTSFRVPSQKARSAHGSLARSCMCPGTVEEGV